MSKQLDAIKDAAESLSDKEIVEAIEALSLEQGTRYDKRYGIPDAPLEPDESWQVPFY